MGGGPTRAIFPIFALLVAVSALYGDSRRIYSRQKRNHGRGANDALMMKHSGILVPPATNDDELQERPKVVKHGNIECTSVTYEQDSVNAYYPLVMNCQFCGLGFLEQTGTLTTMELHCNNSSDEVVKHTTQIISKLDSHGGCNEKTAINTQVGEHCFVKYVSVHRHFKGRRNLQIVV